MEKCLKFAKKKGKQIGKKVFKSLDNIAFFFVFLVVTKFCWCGKEIGRK